MRRELSQWIIWRPVLLFALIVAVACWPTGQTVAQSIEAAWLERAPDLFVTGTVALASPDAVLVDARSEEQFAEATARGSRNLPWQRLVDGERSGRLIDDPEELGRRLSAVAHPDDDVIVFGAWAGTNPLNAWGEEGRLWWSLKTAGYGSVRVVYGGYAALVASGAEVSAGVSVSEDEVDGNWCAAGPGYESGAGASAASLTMSSRWRASAADVAAIAAGPGAVLDTRTGIEYEGATFYGEREGGHIPGASLLWWRTVFENERDLLAPDELDALLQSHGATRGEPVVAYCTGGIRSAFVVMLASALGYDARNYDGSIWEWTNELQRPLE